MRAEQERDSNATRYSACNIAIESLTVRQRLLGSHCSIDVLRTGLVAATVVGGPEALLLHAGGQTWNDPATAGERN